MFVCIYVHTCVNIYVYMYVCTYVKYFAQIVKVMSARRKNTPHFIIENFFGGDSPDNPIAPR